MQKLWDALLARLPAYIYWLDKEGNYINCNLKFAEQVSTDLIHGDEYQASTWHKNNIYALTKHESHIFIEEFSLKNGTRIICQSYKIPINENDDKAVGLVNLSFEVESQKKLLQENHDLKMALNTILANLPAHIYWQNKEGIILGCNENQAISLGFKSTDEVVGKHPSELISKKDTATLMDVLHKVVSTGKPIVLEEKTTYKQGILDMLSQKVPLANEAGEIVGIMGISIDISAQKQAQEREKQAITKEAEAKGKAEAEEQLRQAVTIISGSIAHDLRTPLSIIDMSAERLKKYMPALVEAYHKAEDANLLTEKLQEKLLDNFSEIGGLILEEIHEMKEFITASLKKLSKAIAGDTSAESLALCSMDKCIDQTIRRYPYVGDEHKLVNWNRKADFKFMGNEILMIRILFNLIKNSLEQIKQNKRGEIFITTEMGEKENVLRVKDTAGGAPPEIVEHLFDGYKTTKKEGTGVGLAFCKKLMQDFGGNITCHSEYGDYIEFVLTFPKVAENLQANDNK